MDLTLDHQRRQLRDTVREVLAEHSHVRDLLDDPTTWDRPLYKTLAADLGLTGIAVPARYGGGDGGWRDLAVVCAELGAALAVVPYLGAVLAAEALVASGDSSACAEYLPGIISGSTVAAWCPNETVAFSGGALHGVLPMVPDGSAADLLVILEGTRLFIVDCAASGVSQVALRALDPTRKFARITLDAAPARELPGDVARLRDCAATLVAAEQLGGLTRCVQIATSYAKVREQFGKPIGAFQAVKHSLADLYALQELAESTVRYAAWAADAAPAELALAAAVTKAHLSDAYSRTAADTVHLLGGIGFTWEHDAHLYYKRARITALLHGDATVHRDRVARLLGAAG